MKQSIEKGPSRSINYYLKVLLSIIVFILLINIFVSTLTISITRKQSIDNIHNTVNLYLENAQNKLNAIDHFMLWTVMHEPLIDKMENAQDMSELPKSIADFRLRINDFQYSTGKKFQFFLGLKKENYFFNSSSIQMDYSAYLQMKDFFFTKSKIASLNTYENMSTWNSLEMNEQFYLYHLLEYDNRIFICLISVNDILLPLKDINLGKKGTIVMEKEGNGFLANSAEGNTLKNEATYNLFKSQLAFREKNTGLPFTLHLSVDHFGAFTSVVIAQCLLIVATIIISFILFMILLYIKNRLIYPIHLFSKNLSKINNSKEPIDFQSSSIIELEHANTQFKELITEIKKLKVNIYEQELEKKKTQMDFMRLQIKPHFYVNCLSTIYSMAQMKRYEEIQEMTLSTSKYFRYLFQTNQNFVKLENEINHINDFLAIQKLLHGPTFLFECNLDPNIEDTNIPPLLLQTFVENIMKHGVSLEDDLITISLFIHYLHSRNNIFIIIKDNGPGYPSETLTKLQNKIPLFNENGRYIGINNVIQRLRLLYGEEYSIRFFNDPNGGAVVELMIPYLPYKE
ncbi:MAG: histidine kinase [Bacillus sp. (in: firmicutes)]